jgi:CRP/FNR family transcriptional regulator
MQDYYKFLKQFRVKRFKKGELILCQGEVPACVFVVKAGIVKTYNLTAGGEEKPIGFDIKDEFFPVGWIFGKVERAQYYYEAFIDSEVYCVPLDAYTAYLHTHPDRMLTILKELAGRYTGGQMRINALEQSKASHKVVNTLHFLCLRYGEPFKKNVIKIQIPLTQQDLANFIGLTRETTGIELKKLQKQGILTCRKQSYFVRTDKLDELLDEDYGFGLVEPFGPSPHA